MLSSIDYSSCVFPVHSSRISSATSAFFAVIFKWEDYPWETNHLSRDTFVPQASIPGAIPYYSWVSWLTYEFIFSTSTQISFLLTYNLKSSQFSCIIIVLPFSGRVCISLVTWKYFLLCFQEYHVIVFIVYESSSYLVVKYSTW